MDLSGRLGAALPMSMVEIGASYRVARLVGGHTAEHRLLAMGLGPGRDIRVLRRDGGKLILALGESRLAIGLGIAGKVMLIPLARKEADHG